MRLSVARTVASVPSPAIQRAEMSGMPLSATSPTTTQGRNTQATSARPAVSGMKYARIPGRNIPPTLISALAVLEFLVPRHLDGLELRFVRGLRIVVESVERQHVRA